jgi:hypothetical protein
VLTSIASSSPDMDAEHMLHDMRQLRAMKVALEVHSPAFAQVAHFA